MDLEATQEWSSCEAAEFKALFAELRNEKPCDRMEVLAKRFPAKTVQQLRDKYAEVFADMLYSEIDGQPSRDDATSDLHDWYRLLEGDAHDSVLGPPVETSLFQPSEQVVFKAAGDQEGIQRSHCEPSRKERQAWTAEEHRFFHTHTHTLLQFCFIIFLFLYILLYTTYTGANLSYGCTTVVLFLFIYLYVVKCQSNIRTSIFN
jgi:hypothetical protein